MCLPCEHGRHSTGLLPRAPPSRNPENRVLSYCTRAGQMVKLGVTSTVFSPATDWYLHHSSASAFSPNRSVPAPIRPETSLVIRSKRGPFGFGSPISSLASGPGISTGAEELQHVATSKGMPSTKPHGAAAHACAMARNVHDYEGKHSEQGEATVEPVMSTRQVPYLRFRLLLPRAAHVISHVNRNIAHGMYYAVVSRPVGLRSTASACGIVEKFKRYHLTSDDTDSLHITDFVQNISRRASNLIPRREICALDEVDVAAGPYEVNATLQQRQLKRCTQGNRREMEEATSETREMIAPTQPSAM